MTEIRKIIRVFLASPGDLSPERHIARQVIDELNQSWAGYLGYHLKLVGWELTLSGMGRPQELINRDLETCEYFLGLLWKRWGTPPDQDGKYTSGFEEEFSLSVLRYRSVGKPYIALLFKNIDKDDLQDPGFHLSNVLEFRKRVQEERTALFEAFSSTDEFRIKMSRLLASYLQSLKLAEDSGADRSNSRSFESEKAETDTKNRVSGLFSTSALRFLRQIQDDSTNKQEISNISVARFRLLATMVHSSGNDDNELGVHDANLLYQQGSELDLGSDERIGLAECGLAYYRSENVPFWRWAWELGPTFLFRQTIFGRSIERRVGAFSALVDAGIPAHGDGPSMQSVYYDMWFDDFEAPAVRIAALNYLSAFGSTSDLEIINKEIAKNDYQTAGPAASASIEICLRDSAEKAFRTLVDLQPDSVSDVVIKKIFLAGDLIPNDLLQGALTHKNAKVRLGAFRALDDRRALTAETAQALLTDSDYDLRLEAILYLVADGNDFDSDRARRILTSRSPRTSIFGLRHTPDETRYKIYDASVKSRKGRAELLVEVDESIWYNFESLAVLANRNYGEYRGVIRGLLESNFAEVIESEVSKIGADGKTDSAEVDKFMSTAAVHVKALATRACEVIAQSGDERDLDIIRRSIQNDRVKYSRMFINYLGGCGEWDDIMNVVKCLDLSRDQTGSSLLMMSGPEADDYEAAADSIVALGRGRLNEVFAVGMPASLTEWILITLNKAEAKEVKNDAYIKTFVSTSANVRKAAAITAVQFLPKSRVVELLGEYLKGDEIYYNVIFWLDYGVRMPRKISEAGVARLIERTW